MKPLILGGVVLAFACSAGFAASTDTPSAQTTRPDDTKINKRDKEGSAPTAQNQSNNSEDRKVLADVRKAIVKDKSLSANAHNIKILAAGGTVTLRGPVKTTEEKSKVEEIAQQVAGVDSVKNELDVKSQN